MLPERLQPHGCVAGRVQVLAANPDCIKVAFEPVNFDAVPRPRQRTLGPVLVHGLEPSIDLHVGAHRHLLGDGLALRWIKLRDLGLGVRRRDHVVQVEVVGDRLRRCLAAVVVLKLQQDLDLFLVVHDDLARPDRLAVDPCTALAGVGGQRQGAEMVFRRVQVAGVEHHRLALLVDVDGRAGDVAQQTLQRDLAAVAQRHALQAELAAVALPGRVLDGPALDLPVVFVDQLQNGLERRLRRPLPGLLLARLQAVGQVIVLIDELLRLDRHRLAQRRAVAGLARHVEVTHHQLVGPQPSLVGDDE